MRQLRCHRPARRRNNGNAVRLHDGARDFNGSALDAAAAQFRQYLQDDCLFFRCCWGCGLHLYSCYFTILYTRYEEAVKMNMEPVKRESPNEPKFLALPDGRRLA